MLNNQTGLKRLIFAHAAAGELPPINEYTVTGNPAEFSTNLARSLQSFEIPFSPVQSGSGDPSPSNIRPISGWAGLTINANNNLIMVEWQSVAGVVYGGTVDLVTGVMTVTWLTVDLGTIDWTLANNTTVRQAWLYNKLDEINMKQIESNQLVSSAISTVFKTVSASSSWYPNYLIQNAPAAGAPGRITVTFEPGTYASGDEVKNALDGIPMAYELETPQTVQLSPAEIKTIIGQNSIGTNTNGTNTIKYLKRG